MKIGKRILAVVIVLTMLLGMTPAMAREFPEDQCLHWNGEYRYPNGRSENCLDIRPADWFCLNCQKVIYTNEDIGEHKEGYWDWDGDVPANCKEEGLWTLFCERCHMPLDEAGKNGPHKPSGYTAVAPTCTEPGRKEFVCAYCGTQMEGSEEIPKLGHNWGEWYVVKKATCYEDGVEERVCKRCGASETKPIPKHDHDMGPWYVAAAPTKDHPGLEERVCEYYCGYYEQREIPFEGEDNEEGYIAVRKSVSSTPANGSYYVEGEKISYVITVENRTEGDLTNVTYCDPLFGSPDRDYSVAHGDRVEANTDDYVTLGYIVTAQDVANGQIVNQAYVTCYSEYEGRTVTIKSNTVTVPTGKGDLPNAPINPPNAGEYDGTAAIDLALENAPASVNAAAGDKVTVQLSVTNIGNITLRADTYSMFYPNGEPDNFSNFSLWAPVNDDSTWDFFKPGSVMTTDLDIVVTEDDVAAGQIVRTFNHFAAPYYLIDENGAQTDIPLTLESANLPHSGIKALHPWAVSDTVEIVIPIGETPAGEYGFASLEKSIVSTPANGAYYVPGEAITFHIKLVIPEGLTLSDVEITDPLKGNNEDSVLDILPTVTSADNTEYTFDYIVTTEDALRGYVENIASASFYDPEGDAWVSIDSNPVVADCYHKFLWVGNIETAIGGLAIEKFVTNAPANGQFFVPGENVDYMITVKNTGSLPLEAVTVRDALHSSSEPVAICPVWLEPGEQFDASFTYRVTEMDAVRGSVKNIANAVGYDPEGKALAALSNEVVIPVGSENFMFGENANVSIVKEETSTPANGSYYTEGETIEYKITYTNEGDVQLIEALIFDTLKADDAEIAYAETLAPGESRYCTFSYVVTAEDVAAGYVANVAIVEYSVNGYMDFKTSNVVVSDTDGNDSTTYVPDSGKIDWGEIRGDETDNAANTDENAATEENGSVPIGEDYCYIKAMSRDGDSVEYEVHFCSVHAPTQKAILTMAGSATDAGRQQMVWEYAYALWQKDIDAMYEKLLPACDNNAKITVMNERVTHLAMVANTQFALKFAHPDQAAEAAHAVADLWQYKCIDLCYLMNTAPTERVDSILEVARAQNGAEAHEKCSCVITEEAEGKILMADQYCPVHGFTYEMMELLFLTDNSIETWATIRSLWEIELNTAYNALYKAAGEGSGAVYLAEYAAYMSWLDAYEQFMTAAYPNDPQTVAEVTINAIMERTMDICARME